MISSKQGVILAALLSATVAFSVMRPAFTQTTQTAASPDIISGVVPTMSAALRLISSHLEQVQ